MTVIDLEAKFEIASEKWRKVEENLSARLQSAETKLKKLEKVSADNDLDSARLGAEMTQL